MNGIAEIHELEMSNHRDNYDRGRVPQEQESFVDFFTNHFLLAS